MLKYWFMYRVGPIMLLMQLLLWRLHPQGQYKSFDANLICLIKWSETGFRQCDLSGRFFWIHDISFYETESVYTQMAKFE